MIKGNASEWSSPTLKELRERAGLSQEALARLINVSFRTVQTWEKGSSKPGLDKAVALGKALGVSLKGVANAMGLDTLGLLDDLPRTEKLSDSYLFLWQLSHSKDNRPYLGQALLPIGIPDDRPQSDLEQVTPPEEETEVE